MAADSQVFALLYFSLDQKLYTCIHYFVGFVDRTGRIAGRPLGSDGKGLAVESITKQKSADPKDCIAYGDSIADLGMLQAVGQVVQANRETSTSTSSC